MADALKAEGNKLFAEKKFAESIEKFSQAIELDPSNHVLYSNRSGAYASLKDWQKALEDANKVTEIKPDWAKGWGRKGTALHGEGDLVAATEAFEEALKLDPSNAQAKSGLDAVKRAVEAEANDSGAGLGGMFSDPNMIQKLAANPKTAALLGDAEFMSKLQQLQKNPNMAGAFMQDPRFLQVMSVLLGIDMSFGQGPGAGGAGDAGAKEAEEDVEMPDARPAPSQPKKEPEPEPEPEPMEVPDEEKEAKERKLQAQKEKEAGNAAYKKKDFETAINHYSKALELDDEDISFLTNRAAVYLEMGKYEDCIKDCDKAVERGRELRSDFKMIARALTRKGTAYVKLAKCSKDYDIAIETFQKALTEHRNPDTLKKLNDAEKAKKDLEQQEYFDPKIADEEREKGNEYFKQQQYPEAVKHYTESLRRNPKDVKAYSNRAACYTKLGALPEGLKDAEKCIELDPTFVKGYTRKGAIQFFMKEYEKAMETYQEGLKHDPKNQELLDGIRRCVEQVNKASRGDLTPEELKERQAKAMQDPEIQSILTDPVMRQVLIDFQENPKAAQEHTKNPMVMNKIQKLISAGIVQMR